MPLDKDYLGRLMDNDTKPGDLPLMFDATVGVCRGDAKAELSAVAAALPKMAKPPGFMGMSLSRGVTTNDKNFCYGNSVSSYFAEFSICTSPAGW
jgi:hypothetical protein